MNQRGCILIFLGFFGALFSLMVGALLPFLAQQSWKSERAEVKKLSAPLTSWEGLQPGQVIRFEGALLGEPGFHTPASKMPCVAYVVKVILVSRGFEEINPQTHEKAYREARAPIFEGKEGPGKLIFRGSQGEAVCSLARCLAMDPPRVSGRQQKKPEFVPPKLEVRSPLGYEFAGFEVEEWALVPGQYFLTGTVRARVGPRVELEGASWYSGSQSEVVARAEHKAAGRQASLWNMVLVGAAGLVVSLGLLWLGKRQVA